LDWLSNQKVHFLSSLCGSGFSIVSVALPSILAAAAASFATAAITNLMIFQMRLPATKHPSLFLLCNKLIMAVLLGSLLGPFIGLVGFVCG
jgi:hypothetical protein